MAKAGKKAKPKQVTRYTYEDVKEPRTPETGHTSLLPGDEQVVALPMDNGWSKAVHIGKLPDSDERPVVVDMDPAADPVLFWAGKRNRREVPLLPLQRNEIVSESRIAQIIDRARKAAEDKSGNTRQGHLFADLEKSLRETDKRKRVEFYTHDEGWKNKLVCGDSLHVMESLLQYESLRGRIQMIYMDPPYGVAYNSNFQQRVGDPSNDPNDAADDVLTVKAFRDTWSLGIHSYLEYLKDRLYLARDLLGETGSIFVQISEDNVHLVRVLMSEVFGEDNFCGQIAFVKTAGLKSDLLASTNDYLLWYARNRSRVFFTPLYETKEPGGAGGSQYTWVELPGTTTPRAMTDDEISNPALLPKGSRIMSHQSAYTTGSATTTDFVFEFQGRKFKLPPRQRWRTTREGMDRLAKANRLFVIGNSLRYKRYIDDFPYFPLNQSWPDTSVSGFAGGKVYVVQTNEKVVSRCVRMTTRPGDIVFDPTCGSGTTAVAAERFARRWITCDTSRVAINTARQRLLSALFEHYTLAGKKVADGFVYEEATRTTLEAIATGKESERVVLHDRPIPDATAIRVCGPFEVSTLGRYSVEDWKGYVLQPSESGDTAKLENYIEVICRLYRPSASIQGATGLVHAIAEAEKEKIAISVGPLSGRVTAKQINDAVQDAIASGVLELHVLGWAFEANVGEVKSALEKRGKVTVELIMIRPDTLADGLKVTKAEALFSPLALPDIDLSSSKSGKEKLVAVSLNGVALFDRKRRTTEYKSADSGYVSAWYLDEDYDGDCFVDCQMFFDFKKAPNLKATLKADVDPEEFTLRLTSEPFPIGAYRRIAVKVVDVYGNEAVVVRDLA
jgi:adenine-specific DNA-methyltransferase